MKTWSDLSADYPFAGYVDPGDGSECKKTEVRISIHTGSGQDGDGVTLSMEGGDPGREVHAGVYFSSFSQCRELLSIVHDHLGVAEREREQQWKAAQAADQYLQLSKVVDLAIPDQATRWVMKKHLRQALSLEQ